MKKKSKLNAWLWKWHFIAGIISLPFVLLLSITGIIYLFKSDYETPRQKYIKEVVVSGTPISLQEQWVIANKNATKKPNALIINSTSNQATEFVSGRFSHKSSVFINPYNGMVTGEIIGKKTNMHTVRKLHGELLMGSFGTKIIELIASWMIVLIATGLYVWWQKITNTGYPPTWEGRQLQSNITGEPLVLDQMVAKAKTLQLPGQVTLSFPKGPKGVFSVANFNPSDLDSQQKIHFDQYSGKQILKHTWKDVGILMRARMWFMAFHQGEFGAWNWWLVLVTAIILTVMSISAIISYLLRKRTNSWSVPKVPSSFKVGYGISILIILLSLVFPLFGISLLVILAIESLRKYRSSKIS